MVFLALIVFFFLCFSSGAEAGPVFFAVLSAGGSFGAAFGATAVGSFIGTTVGRLLVTVALSALSSALNKPKTSNGLKTQVTQTGGINPQSFIIGKYATSGSAVCPPMSHGDKNKFLTYVIDVSDIAIEGINRLIVDGKYIDLSGAVHADYGLGATGDYAGFLWAKFYDGTQTTADPMLLSKYGSYPERPWTSDMIGRGVAYAIITFKLKNDLYQGLPTVRFEVLGIPMYDPRKDTTVGGSGSHRWNDKSTWEFTENTAVQIYNIKRGISFLDGSVWGGEFPGEDLPLSSWFTAMNVCDVSIPRLAGGTEPQYRSGTEVKVDEEPASVIEDLLRSCSGQVADIGGLWKIRVGPVGMPIYFVEDGDIIISEQETMTPFVGLEQTYNGIHASYVEPESLWEMKDAPPIYNSAWEAEDDGRRLVADLNLDMIPYASQVQRVMNSYILDERKQRRLIHSLPPSAIIIEPLDSYSYTSERNNFTSKVFEVFAVSDDPFKMWQSVSSRERDPDDYDWDEADEFLAEIALPLVVEPNIVSLTSFSVVAISIDDSVSPRRPAIGLMWDGTDLEDSTGLLWEIRLAGETNAFMTGTYQNPEDGKYVISSGILPNVNYEVRAKLISDVPSDYTVWTPITSLDIRLTEDDLDTTVIDLITEIAYEAGITTVSSLPASGSVVGQIVMLVPPGRLYRWTGSAWSTAVYGGIEDASLTTAAFASSIRPVELVAILPSTGNFAGRVVFLTTDNKIYRHNGTAWTVSVDGGDILTGSIIAGKIAAGAISAAEMSIGFGANWLANPDFFSGTSHWLISGTGDPVGVTTLALRGPGDTWSGLQYPTLMVYQSTSGSSGYTNLINGPIYNDAGAFGVGYPVKPGDRLQMFAQFSLHRCTAHRWIQWLDATGASISFSSFGDIPEGAGDSANPDLWPVYGGFATAPANAAYARPYIRKTATTSGANSFMFIHKPFLGLALANQTAFSPWDAGRATKIDGNRIVSDTVEARHMKTDSVVANSIVAGAVIASKLAAGAVVAGKLSAGAIDAGSLIVDGVISKRKIMDYTTYAVLPTGVAGTVPASFITIGTVDFAVAPYVSIGGQYYNPGVWQISGEIQLQFGQGASIYLALQSQPVGGGAWTTHFTLDIYMGSSSVFFQRITDFTGVFSSTTRTYRAVAWCRAGSLPPYLRNAHSLLEQVSK